MSTVTDRERDYIALNASLNLYDENHQIQFHKDEEAARQYFLQHVNQNTVFFHSLEEKLEYLFEEEYYEKEWYDQYRPEFVKEAFKRAYAYKHRFKSFVGAYKYYTSYTLRTFDGKRYLERYEDRVTVVALYLAGGDEKRALDYLDEMMTGRFQPATPTFLNLGKKQRGEPVSCFPAGTLVTTDSGRVAIEKLKVGDKVLSHDGTFNDVTELIVNDNQDNLVRIKHYGSKDPILSTPNHPILVWTNREVTSLTDGDGADVENGFVWLEAQDVQPGDFIVDVAPTEIREPNVYSLFNLIYNDNVDNLEVIDGVIQKKNIDAKTRFKTPYSQSFVSVNDSITEDYNLGLILGWYLSEGYVSKRVRKDGKVTPNGVHFTLGTHEVAFQQELVNTLQEVFGVEAKIKASNFDGSTKISVHSRVVGEFLLSLAGTGFNKKSLPEELLTANLDFQKGILHGAFRGDGHTTNGALTIDLVNPELINSLRLLLTRAGIISRIRTYVNSSGNVTGQLVIPGIAGENEEFIFTTGKNLNNYVGLKGNGKNLKNSEFYRVQNGRFVYEVADVVVTDEIPEKVYNLEVDRTHTYVVSGAVVHNCFLLRLEDNMESIARSINASLQLSKRGGGVALLLSNLREEGAPIKKVEGQSSGVVPVMKMLEDAFSYANQLGARQGAGAVYLNAHHPDIMAFLDTKRENADEKVRIKTLSLGVVIPDITFELAKNNEEMYLFSPYDVERVYGKPFADISVSEHYREMVDNEEIRKTKIKARDFFQILGEVQIQSGYPYVMFEDTVNRANPIKGKINMSNLCSEILQVNTPSTYSANLNYDEIGKDISCNLGSLNIAKVMEGGNIEKTVEASIRALTYVSETSDISSVPSIDKGNQDSAAVGLGQMNLHGYLGSQRIHYGSEEGLDFTNIYFYTVAYSAIKASNKIARETGKVFVGFEDSKYASGEYFTKYIEQEWVPQTEKVANIFKEAGIHIPTQEDWKQLAADVAKYGMRNSNLQAVAPTGSISYVAHATPSIHPITSLIEIRKEGKIGRVYNPAYGLTNDNIEYYQDAYTLGYEKLIDTYAVATQHVDQGLSLTLFFPEGTTTRTLNKAQIYAWRKGIKTLYYVRLAQAALEGTESNECVSCAV